MPQKLIIIGCTDPSLGKRQRVAQASLHTSPSLSLLVEWMDYSMLLNDPEKAIALLDTADWIKWDTPGESRVLYTFFAQAGWQKQQQGIYPEGYLEHEIPHLRWWFTGYSDFLLQWAKIGQTRGWQWLNSPASILALSDKWRCQKALSDAHLSVPTLLGLITGYDDLLEKMEQNNCQRVFVKARYGSSAAGVFAYQRNSAQQETLQCCLQYVDGRWFYCKNVFQLREKKTIAQYIDTFAEMGLYAEHWIPKPTIDQQQRFDFRVITMQGKAQHTVARASSKVFTNLHLDGERILEEDPRIATYFSAAQNTAEQAAQIFPSAQLVGWDIIVRPKQTYILEGNSFGDYLPQLLHQGLDTYQSQFHLLASRGTA